MKKPLILIFLIVLLIVGFSLATVITSHSKPQTGAMQSSSQKTQQTYILGPRVIGSGGVLGATGQNHLHFATAGQLVVGGAQGANNIVLPGFWHMLVILPTEVDANEETDLPTSFELYQNYPNPFNPQTTIRYDIPKTSYVTLEIFNVVGQRIRLLLEEQNQGHGTIQVVWDGRDDKGRIVGSGIYIYRIEASTAVSGNILFQDIRKMLFIK